MEIRTERLILRNITEDDAEDIFEYSKNKNVGISAGWEPHKSIDDTREILRAIFIGKPYVFGIILAESGKLIGSVGLIDDPKREYDGSLMLGYSLSESYWGRGIMSEAAKAVIKCGFETAGADIITAYCYPYSIASKRIIEKIGMKYEGLLRKAEKRFDGAVLDNLCYSLTSAEYGEMK